MASSSKHPMIYWAQSSKNVLLTIEVEDMNVTLLKIEGNKFHFQGSNKEGFKYKAELELYDDLKGSDVRRIPTARHVKLIIPKEKEEWWPRLLKTTAKVQWINVDFNKWVDEDGPYSPRFGAFLPILNDNILRNVGEGYMSVENAAIYIMDGIKIFTQEVMKSVYDFISNYYHLPGVTTHLKSYIFERKNPYQLYLNWAKNITEDFGETILNFKDWGKSRDEELAEFLYYKIVEQSNENFGKLDEIVKQNKDLEKLLQFHIAAGYMPNGAEIENSFDAFRECKEKTKKNVDLKVKLIPYIDREIFPDQEARKKQYGNVGEEDDHNLNSFKAAYNKTCHYFNKYAESRTDKNGKDIAIKEVKIVKDEEGEDVKDENGKVVTVDHWHPKYISVDMVNCAYYNLDRSKFKSHYTGFGLDKTRVFIIQTPTERTLHEIYFNIFHEKAHLMEWGGRTDSEGKRPTQVSENLQNHQNVYKMELGTAMFKLTGKKRDKGRTFAPWSYDTKYLKKKKLMIKYLARNCVDLFWAKDILDDKSCLPKYSLAHTDEICEEGDDEDESQEEKECNGGGGWQILVF